jgi:hypothetical protein
MNTAIIGIKKHERDAIEHLIICVRGLASVINDADDVYVKSLLAWATIVETLLDRLENQEGSK